MINSDLNAIFKTQTTKTPKIKLNFSLYFLNQFRVMISMFTSMSYKRRISNL